MKALKYMILTLSLCLFSCVHEKEKEGKFYTIMPVNEKTSALVDKVDFIQLDDSLSESMFSSVAKLVIAGERIYIMDGNVSSIYSFDLKTGRFIYKLDKVGQGPGEYIRLRDFNVANGILYVYDDRRRKLIFYRAESGDYIEEKGTSFYARAFSLLNNGDFLFVLPKDQEHSQVVVTDSCFEIKAEYLPFAEDDLDNHTRYCLLQENDDKIVYSKPDDNQIGLFSKDDGTLLDQFRLFVNENKEKKDQLKITPLLVNNHLLGTYNEEGKLYFYDITLDNEGHLSNSSVRSFKDENNTAFDLLYPLYACNDSTVVSYFTAEVYEQMSKSRKLDENDEHFLLNGGFLLGFYHLVK